MKGMAAKAIGLVVVVATILAIAALYDFVMGK